MKWYSGEIEPSKNGIYLILAHDGNFYFGRFFKRGKWDSFTHFALGNIQWPESHRIHVRAWYDWNKKKIIQEMLFPDRPERLNPENPPKEDKR
jgi:hypothetical protein